MLCRFLSSSMIGLRPNSSFPARTYAPSPAVAISAKVFSSNFVTTIFPSLSLRSSPFSPTGIGLPSGEPTPMVKTLIPTLAASSAAATGLSSWFSPSVMSIIALSFLVCSVSVLLKLLMQVVIASAIAVPCTGTEPVFILFRKSFAET